MKRRDFLKRSGMMTLMAAIPVTAGAGIFSGEIIKDGGKSIFRFKMGPSKADPLGQRFNMIMYDCIGDEVYGVNDTLYKEIKSGDISSIPKDFVALGYEEGCFSILRRVSVRRMDYMQFEDVKFVNARAINKWVGNENRIMK